MMMSSKSAVRIKLLSVSLVYGLLAGCTVVPKVEPTDLSSVAQGEQRASVEEVFGEPISAHKLENRETRIYKYNLGAAAESAGVATNDPFTTLALWPIVLLATPFAYADKVEDQRGYIAVAYDAEGNVQEATRIVGGNESEVLFLALGVEDNELRGTERSEFESLLDAPEEIDTTPLGSVALYRFPESWTLPDVETDYILVTYDGGDRVSDYLRTAWRVDSVFIRYDAQSEGQNLYRLAREAYIDDRARWYCRAAQLSHAGGFIYMGQIYQFGYGGTPTDLVEAYKWYTLARLKNEPRADMFIEKAILRMSSDEIAAGERLAKEWQPDPEECDVLSSPETGSTQTD